MKNEKRFYSGSVQIEKREDGEESRTISGYGLVFDKWSTDLGWFREKIDSSALDGVDLSAVIASRNHDFDKVVARADSDTLDLTIDEKGLKYSFEAPNTTVGNDLLEDVRNGNIKGSSFYFGIEEDGDTWERPKGKIRERTINQFAQIIELGPVTFPAYPDTTALAKRMAVEMPDKPDTTIEDLKLKRKRLKNWD